MTPERFRQILREEYFVHYPETAKWAAALPQVTKDAWAKLFEGIEERDLRAAITRTVSGMEDPIKWFDRDKTATILRQRAIERANARRERESTTQRQKEMFDERQAMKTDGGSRVRWMGRALRAINRRSDEEAARLGIKTRELPDHITKKITTEEIDQALREQNITVTDTPF